MLRVIKAAQRLGFTLTEVAELLEVGAHRGPRPGLRQRARDKLSDVDDRITRLTAMRETLVVVIEAGCSDLMECSCQPACPIPFADLDGPDRHAGGTGDTHTGKPTPTGGT